MNKKLGFIVAATLLGLSVASFADSTEDLINALVSKGILTEDEADVLSKKNVGERHAQEKKDKSKLSISKYLDEGKLYGDIRVRQEWRGADEYSGSDSIDRSRQRYKITLGFKTKISENWFTDLALSMGSRGRSDNATFGSESGYQGNKNELFVKRAMIGWTPTDWLTLQAGRIKNPLYTKPMIWDKDLTWDGASWRTKYKMSNQTTISTTGGVNTMQGDDKQSVDNADTDSQYQISGQVIGKHMFDNKSGPSFKTGLTYTMYTNDDNLNTKSEKVFNPSVIGDDATGINDLSLIEIPADYKMMVKPGLGMTLFGDYAYNLDGDDRRKAAISAFEIDGGSDDNSAFMIGVGFGSYKDFIALDRGKQKKGDWKGNIWYQEVGTYSVDPNHVDSDIFDSKVNLKGIAFKGQYMIEDNVKFNVAYAYGEIKDKSVGCTPGVTGDTGMCIDSMDLIQLDVTYKF